MRNLKIFAWRKWQSAIFLVAALSSLHGAHADGNTWTETTVEDFSDNQIENLVVTDLQDGEVELRMQLIKTMQDTLLASIDRFIAWDNSKTYYRKTWVADNNLFVQKRSPIGEPLENPIRVNDNAGTIGWSATSRVAIADNEFMVTWRNGGNPAPDNNMYGQIFNANGTRVGTNFQLTDQKNNGGHCALILANRILGTFDILFQQGNYDDGSKLSLQRYDGVGNRIYFSRLNRENLTKYERANSFAQTENGDIVVTWEGSDAGVSTLTDIFVRKFDYSGSPLTPAFKVNDDAGENSQFESFVQFDESSNFLVVWTDMRENRSEIGPYEENIYGQLYTKTCQKIGRNFLINIPKNSEDREPEIQFRNGRFHVSWRSYNSERQINELFLNKWELDPIYRGTMISSVFDAGTAEVTYDQLFSEAFLPDSATIQFQLRSASSVSDIENSEWFGPNQIDSTYFASVVSKINPIHNGCRFIQYKALFEINNITQNPSLQSVSIFFTPSDLIPPSPPSNFVATNGHSQVMLTWDENPEPDISHYLLYRGQMAGQYDSTWTLQLDGNQTGYIDTSAVTGNRYFYALTAVDLTYNEGASSVARATPYGINIFVESNAIGGNGSETNPFSTIAEAQTVAYYGDTLLILPGAYEETVDMKRGVSLVGTNANTTEIRGTKEGITIINAADDALIKNLSLIRTSSRVQDVIRCYRTSPTIVDNIIVNYVEEGDTGIGIAVEPGSPDISGNIIKGFMAGISTTNYESFPTGSINISNNIINTISGAVYCQGDSGSEIINNTFIINSAYGLRTKNCKSLNVKNNIFYGTDAAEANGINNRNSAIQMDYNCFWNLNQNYSRILPGEHDLSLDPLFLNVEKEDFRLSADSPCINTGDPDSFYFDTDGTRNDMGAFGGPHPNKVAIKSRLIKSIGVAGFSGFPGDTVRTWLWVQDPEGLDNFKVEISFDLSLLEFLSVGAESQTDESLSINQLNRKEGAVLKIQAKYKRVRNDNNILELLFKVKQNAVAMQATSLSFEKASLFDEKEQEIKLRSITDGTFVVSRGNKDGRYIFVNSNNDDSGDGTQYLPFNTIQKAVNKASAGDTIIVAAGDYMGKITMKDSVYLRGAGVLVTTLFTPADMREYGIVFDHVNNSEVSGFSFKAINDEIVFDPVITCISSSPVITKNIFSFNNEPMPVISCEKNSRPTINNNTFNNRGIRIQNSEPIVNNNHFYVRFGPPIECFDFSFPIIIRNKFYDNVDNNIAIRQSSAKIIANWFMLGPLGSHAVDVKDATTIEIKSNIIEGFFNDASGLKISNSNDVLICNNTINTLGKGIQESLSSGAIYNNIIVGNRGFGIQHSPAMLANYNALWNNYINYYQGEPGVEDIFMDPLFQDSEHSNYQLKITSPAVDKGHPGDEFLDEDGSRNDIGAYGGPDAHLLDNLLPKVNLEILSQTVPPLDTLEIKLLAKGIKGLANLELSVQFEEDALTFINAKTTDATKSFILEKSRPENNSIFLKMQSSVGILEDSTSILSLNFETENVTGVETKIDISGITLRDDVNNPLTLGNFESGVISIFSTSVKNDDRSILPNSFELYQNYPNPFNSNTMIKMDIPARGRVTLKVFDILGREVAIILDKSIESGIYTVSWKGIDHNGLFLPSGLYFVRMEADGFEKIIKTLLLK